MLCSAGACCSLSADSQLIRIIYYCYIASKVGQVFAGKKKRGGRFKNNKNKSTSFESKAPNGLKSKAELRFFLRFNFLQPSVKLISLNINKNGEKEPGIF